MDVTNHSETNNIDDTLSSSSPSSSSFRKDSSSPESNNIQLPLSRQVLFYDKNNSGDNRCGLLSNPENNKKGSTPRGVINNESLSSLSSPPASPHAAADRSESSLINFSNDKKTNTRSSSSSIDHKKMTRRSSSSSSSRSNNNNSRNSIVNHLPPARFSGDDETVECSSLLESSFYPLTLSLSPSSVIGVKTITTTAKSDSSNKDDNASLASSIPPSLISQHNTPLPSPFNNISTSPSLISSLTSSPSHPFYLYLLSDMMSISLHSFIRHIRIQRQYAVILQQHSPHRRAAIPVGFDALSLSSASFAGSSSVGFPSCDLSSTSTRRRRRRRRQLFRHASSLCSTSSLPSHPTPESSKKHVVVIRGLVNKGQTCFLNAILQALASLPPLISFLSSSYKESLKQRLRRRHCHEELMGLLLELLLDIGGRPLLDDDDNYSGASRREDVVMVVGEARDPMEILELVGRKHGRFGRSGGGGGGMMEQQDAQEFLQALMGMIVLPGEEEDDGGDGDVFSNGFDDEMDETEHYLLSSLDWGEDDGETEDLSLSFTSLVQKMDEELSRVTKEKRRGGVDGVRKGGDKREGGYGRHDGDLDITMDIDIDSMRRTAAAGKGKEEKKGEDFYFDDHYESSYAAPDVPPPENDKHTLSTILSSDNQEKSCSELEQSTLGTSSPLSGWLGSHLQCASCHHIRPIQNDPFLDIPVIPTSISSFLSANNTNIHTPPPSAYQSPCTLQECLHNFTSMERVREVECTSCTIRSEVQSIKDEISLLENAIKSISHKQSKSKNQPPDTTNVSELQQELLSYRYRLYHLTHVHPDSSSSIQTKTATLSTDDNTTSSSSCSQNTYSSLISNLSSPPSQPTQRHDADKKLLLTRPPSILCLHVQRRYYDASSQRMRKTNQHVTFPLILDMKEYCAYAGSYGVLYELRSVIEHLGDAEGGHYLTYRRLMTTTTTNGAGAGAGAGDGGREWVRVSDDKVEFVDWNVVCRCQAYMLFYEQICDF